MTPRKGKDKQDKHSDSESEMQLFPEKTQFTKTRTSYSTKSNAVARNNPKVLARLLAFGGLLSVTFATRFYAIDQPEHIW